MRALLVGLMLVVIAPAARADAVSELKKGQPKEVADLIDRIVGCNHWSGEEPYDAERQSAIEKAITERRCNDLATDEAMIRRKAGRKAGEAIDAAKDLYL